MGICLYLNKKIAIYFLIVCSLVGGCSYINKKLGFNDDWMGEEILEEMIKKETNLEIDLTPESEEVTH